jgi:hypothetical protein
MALHPYRRPTTSVRTGLSRNIVHLISHLPFLLLHGRWKEEVECAASRSDSQTLMHAMRACGGTILAPFWLRAVHNTLYLIDPSVLVTVVKEHQSNELARLHDGMTSSPRLHRLRSRCKMEKKSVVSRARCKYIQHDMRLDHLRSKASHRSCMLWRLWESSELIAERRRKPVNQAEEFNRERIDQINSPHTSNGLTF